MSLPPGDQRHKGGSGVLELSEDWNWGGGGRKIEVTREIMPEQEGSREEISQVFPPFSSPASYHSNLPESQKAKEPR